MRAPAAVQASPPSAVLDASGPVRLEARDDAGRLPVLAIEQPAEGEEVPFASAMSRSIVVRDGGFLDRSPSGRVALVLDRDVVRDVTAAELQGATLGSLFPEDRDISPGEHVLAVVACDADGRGLRDASGRAQVAVRRFFVGPSQAGTRREDPGAPFLVVLQPRGTLNGPHAAPGALLDVIVHGVELSPRQVWLEVTMSGPGGRSRALLQEQGQFWLRGLESGDHRIEVRLEGAPAAVWRDATREVTVNLDVRGPKDERPR